MVAQTESIETADSILERDDVRWIVHIGPFTVQAFHVELMMTGELLVGNMSFYGTIGSELAHLQLRTVLGDPHTG